MSIKNSVTHLLNLIFELQVTDIMVMFLFTHKLTAYIDRNKNKKKIKKKDFPCNNLVLDCFAFSKDLNFFLSLNTIVPV